MSVWERRYAAVAPTRSAGGQRLYTDKDVDRFRLLATATRHGRSIGIIARMPIAQLEAVVAADEAALTHAKHDAQAADQSTTVDEALALTRALDGTGLDRVLRHTLAQNGLPAFIEYLIPHLMHRVGDEWSANELTIAQEHLASAAVLAILIETMRALPEPPGARRVVVATPSGEHHAVGAALAATAAALNGWVVVYLGVDVPAADIVSAATATDAGAVVLSAVHATDVDALVASLKAVRNGLPARVPVLVGGAAAHDAADRLARLGLVVCDSFGQMRSVLAERATVHS